MKRYLDHTPRFAVVGFGRWGRCCHSYLISKTEGLELAGVVSSSTEKQAQAKELYQCKTWNTFQEVLQDDSVDAVVLATPNYTHAELAIAALKAGKHVVTDKVMCLDTRECNAMRQAAAESGNLLTVFQNRRLDGDYLTLKQLMDTGELGDVKWLEMAWMGFGIWGGWRGDKAKGGGRILDLGPHLIDQILQLFPEPVQSVFCRTHYDFPDYTVESEALIVITFQGGRTAVVDLSCLAQVVKPRFYARGTKATFIKYGLDPQEAAMCKGNIDDAVEAEANYGRLKSKEKDIAVPTLPGRWRTYYENVRDTLLGKAEPLVSLDEQSRLISVIEAVKRSETLGQVITF